MFFLGIVSKTPKVHETTKKDIFWQISPSFCSNYEKCWQIDFAFIWALKQKGIQIAIWEKVEWSSSSFNKGVKISEFA